MASDRAGVWVFHGIDSRFAGAVFGKSETADEWIASHHLTGVLTWYPLDIGVYDWAVAAGHFTPKRESESTAAFIGGFSSASQEHYHYESGSRE